MNLLKCQEFKNKGQSSPKKKRIDKMGELTLGIIVRDVITDFKGTITQKCTAMGESIEFYVEPRGMDKDGNPKKGRWVNAARLVITED